MELQITLAYHDGRSKIDNLFMGDRAAIIVELLRGKAFGIVICFLILFVGFLFILADVIFSWRCKSKDYSLMYLGIFSVIAALWCLLETNILQLLCSDLRILQVMDDMLLVIASLPLFLYLDCVFDVFQYRLVRFFCVCDMAYIGLAAISQMLGLWDFHETLNGAIFSLGAVCVAMISCIILYNVGKKKKTAGNFNFILQQAGVIAIGIGLAGDLYRYLTSDVMDRAMIIRIGLLGFVICFGAGNMRTLILLVKQGMQTEIISKLAYSDGLTEVGNRTAYVERLETIAAKCEKNLGIVMLDINGLKDVNDQLGHSIGDELIKVCVDVIKSAFGTVGEIYRIGGDEFIVLISEEDPKGLYEKKLPVFRRQIEQENSRAQYEYPVSIACGAAFCNPVSKWVIEDTQNQADKLMYENKRLLKKEHNFSR